MERPVSRIREIAGSSVKVGAATVAGLIGWIVGGKILALELGAAGVGVFGLLRQLLQNLTLASTFNGTTALVQGISSRSGDEQERYARSVGAIYALGASILAVVLVIGAPWLARALVPHPDAVVLVRWMAVAVVATTAQTYFTGLLNAHRAVDALVRSQLMAPAVVILLAYPTAKLVRGENPAGLVLLLAAPGAAVALAAALHARRSARRLRSSNAWIDGSDAKAFFRTSAVMVVTGVLGTGTQYLQNRLIAGGLGLEAAGHYWVAWTLSMAYVTILLVSYGTYYLPALSALKDKTERESLIRDYLGLALVVMPVLVSCVVVLKPLVVLALFSPKLLPALKVMRWMLVGDLLKGVAWVLSFPMLAFGEMRWFLWTEVAFNLLLAGASWAWLAAGGGIEGLGGIFLALYALYLITMCGYVRLSHGMRLRSGEIAGFAMGLSLVAIVSALTWNDEGVRLLPLLVFLVFSGAFVLVNVLRRTGATAPKV